jgi:heat-inducible transcriptional repressor
MEPSTLHPRSGRILATVVREYIQTGEPVASLSIAKRGTVSVSSATVRNILVRLEEQGFVRQPHTSAGRVPTDRGYRFYVDLLLEGHRAGRSASSVEARLRRTAGEEASLDVLLADVSHLLSHESRHVGFAVAPGAEETRLQRIEFVPVASSRILVVVIGERGQVTQKIVDSGDPIAPEALRDAAEYVNREFAGLPLPQVRQAIVDRITRDRNLYDRLMTRALDLAQRTLEGNRQPALFVEGTATLLDEAQQQYSEVSLGTLRALVEMIEEKQRLVRLLSEYLDTPGLTVVIGAEHLAPDLRPFSLVTATYFNGEGAGSVGVIGPTRMRYSRAIAMVDATAQAVTRVLRNSD